jgi:hypothetical protein
VQQRGSLEELHRGAERHRDVPVLAAAGAVAPVGEGGPQPLAAPDQRGDRLDEVGDVGTHLLEVALLAGELAVELCLDPAPEVVGEGVGHGDRISSGSRHGG